LSQKTPPETGGNPLFYRQTSFCREGPILTFPDRPFVYWDKWDGFYQSLQNTDANSEKTSQLNPLDQIQSLRSGEVGALEKLSHSISSYMGFAQAVPDLCQQENYTLLGQSGLPQLPSVLHQNENFTYTKELSPNEQGEIWQISATVSNEATSAFNVTSESFNFAQNRYTSTLLNLKVFNDAPSFQNSLGEYSFLETLRGAVLVEGELIENLLSTQALYRVSWEDALRSLRGSVVPEDRLVSSPEIVIDPPEEPISFEMREGCWPQNGRLSVRVLEGLTTTMGPVVLSFEGGVAKVGFPSGTEVALNLKDHLRCPRETNLKRLFFQRANQAN
jgi:hypothetical protein